MKIFEFQPRYKQNRVILAKSRWFDIMKRTPRKIILVLVM